MDQLTDTQKSYQSLLKSGLLSDVTFVVDGQEFRLHKALLAVRSPVFMAMFTNNNFKEAAESRVIIGDIPVDVFQSLIGFIYGDVTPNLASHPMELYGAADMYQLEELKTRCSTVLASQLTVENAVQVLLLADMHSDAELRKNALVFIAANIAVIKPSESWQLFEAAKSRSLYEDLVQVLMKNHPIRSRNKIGD